MAKHGITDRDQRASAAGGDGRQRPARYRRSTWQEAAGQRAPGQRQLKAASGQWADERAGVLRQLQLEL